MKQLLTLLLTLLLTALGAFAAPDVDFDFDLDPFESDDETVAMPDSLRPLSGNWVQQLWQTGFHINDPRIRYPRFPNFCRKVYNWGDRVFNSYDPNYVVSTGKNWKITVDALGSMQSYGYLFNTLPGTSDFNGVIMRSNIGYDLGVHLNFMAVSIGYTWNMNKLTNFNDAPRSTFTFSFTCARFAVELLNQKLEGNTYLRYFGTYNGGARIHIPLDNTRRNTFSINGYYFLNHNHYSQAAAYCFSKYQKRSAGTWLVGARYSRQFVQIDFTDLPASVLEYKPQGLPLLNQFRFHNIEAQAGYAFNGVMPHNWLFNITVLPGVGYRRSLTQHQTKRLSELISTTIDGRMGFTYNHRAFFANANIRANLSFLFNSGYSFLMSSEQAQIIIGARF
ncbi:MAG: DUF4421 domain-containing protein [Muribaculaceae bacterium]|nr:DUF4421 domain-containing protein [Muribaculaceae bacterium]